MNGGPVNIGKGGIDCSSFCYHRWCPKPCAAGNGLRNAEYGDSAAPRNKQ